MPKIDIRLEPGALSVAEFCKWASVSRAWAYERLRDGTIRSVKRGGRRLIPLQAARDWLDHDKEAEVKKTKDWLDG